MGSEAKRDDELKNRLTEEQYRVTQQPTGLRYCINSASLDFDETS